MTIQGHVSLGHGEVISKTSISKVREPVESADQALNCATMFTPEKCECRSKHPCNHPALHTSFDVFQSQTMRCLTRSSAQKRKSLPPQRGS